MEKKTQKSEVLRYLQSKKGLKNGLTQTECYTLIGSTRLGAIVSVLRSEGYNIVTETKKVKNRYGRTSYPGVYKLVNDEVRSKA